MNYKEVLTAIKNENLSNLYLFWGTEHYLIENTVHHIKEKLIQPAFQDLNYQHIDGRETRIDDIINASETLPFMDSVRLIVIKELECFSGKKKNISEEEEGRLMAYLSQIPKSTHLIFVYTDAIDKRKKIIKEIGKTGHIIEFNKLTEKDAYSWVNKAFQKQKKKVKMEEIKIFLDNSGYLDRNSDKTLKDLENEIIKLINYVGEREMISKEDIQLLASRTIENDIFMLVESIGEKNGEKALRILNDMLIAGEPEVKILHMITRQFRFLYQVKLMENQGYTAVAIAPKIGMQQFIVRKYLKQAINFDTSVLRQAISKCLDTDLSIKKGKMDQKLVLELLICQFTCSCS